MPDPELPSYIEDACEEIDAAIFSGDTFEDPATREELLRRIARWQRGLAAIAANAE